MTIGDYCIIGYGITGMILTVYWWFTEYKQSYEECKSKGECEEPMVILLLLFTTCLWPFILCIKSTKKYYEKGRSN